MQTSTQKGKYQLTNELQIYKRMAQGEDISPSHYVAVHMLTAFVVIID